jgi:hypothetical protein
MISLVLASMLMAGEPAAANGAAQAAPPAKADAGKTNKDGLVCKKEAVVGSRMKSRICLTQAEWDQRQADSRQELDAAQRNRPLTSN